jgi:hypothetical protein
LQSRVRSEPGSTLPHPKADGIGDREADQPDARDFRGTLDEDDGPNEHPSRAAELTAEPAAPVPSEMAGTGHRFFSHHRFDSGYFDLRSFSTTIVSANPLKADRPEKERFRHSCPRVTKFR